jgi:triacylglycerol lipase
MPSIYRRLIELPINGWAWVLDYTYVAYWQVYGFFIKADPGEYDSLSASKIPIILIPGIYENWQFMKPIADMLNKNGHPIHVIDGLGYNTGDIKSMAELVDTYITKTKLASCIIVAHSKGGLIGKYVLANFNAKLKIKAMVAINTPFSGSQYAYLLLPLKSTRIFIPHSPILSLLANNTLVNSQIVSIYGQFDPHIPKGSYLKGAKNIKLKTRGHFRIMKNKDVHQAILRSVETL